MFERFGCHSKCLAIRVLLQKNVNVMLANGAGFPGWINMSLVRDVRIL